MGTPKTTQARLDSLYDWGGIRVREIVVDRWWPWDDGPSKYIEILDVGAGWGKYRFLLPDYPNMDACEIWGPYVKQERLRDLYRNVYVRDIGEMWPATIEKYDLVIWGDVLEHLTPRSAQLALSHCRAAIVVVPYSYPQGEEEGNPYEAHVQDDLTPSLMLERYPDLHLSSFGIQELDRQPYKGIYLKGIYEHLGDPD